MSGPPKAVDPSTLWARLTQLPRPHTIIPYPRRDPKTRELIEERVAIVVLTEAELMSARTAARAYAKEMTSDRSEGAQRRDEPWMLADGGGDIGYREIYHNALIVECVIRACRDVGPDGVAKVPVPAFPSSKLARQHLTSDEFAALYNAYCDFQVESGPLVSQMSEVEMDAWIDKLGEGASRVPLALLTSGLRDDLLMRSASVLRSSRTGSSSAGSPPGGSSSPRSGPSTTDSATPSPPESPLADGEAPPPPETDP